MNPKNRLQEHLDGDLNVTRSTAESADAEDPRLIAAVREYTAALEAGLRPSRQEFVRRHPEIAAELSACLDGLAFVHSAAARMQAESGSAAPSANSEVDPATAAPLGDFRLVRQIGRGGMGVVYEAVQLSLGRRVAVKVLPFAAALDARQLQRFRNEAQAAAQLHHTNIVPVYAVGCERSVHYYAMQLIEGQSLAEVIRELRRIAGRPVSGRRDAKEASRGSAPTAPFRSDEVAPPQIEDTTPSILRPSDPAPLSKAPAESLSLLRNNRRRSFYETVARLGLQAAEALDYAHQQGVVHRDIKPENLLLDVRGNLWITDFGLAQFYAESGLTQTGDLLGTLRYMSPEQASGRAVVLDQRTDIYSLGLTLYELLTLERAIPGETREQLLRQIGQHEPRSPRLIDRNLPPELETILNKTTAKEPADRYQNARALADDLRRFLQDEPILARPPSILDKTVKWTRRHRGVAVAALVMLVFATIALSVSTILIARAQGDTKAALVREEKKGNEAREQRQRADEQRNRAERSLRQARDAVGFLTDIATDELGHPFMADVRRAMLERSLIYYEDFLGDREEEATVGATLAEDRARVKTLLDELAAAETFELAKRRLWFLRWPAVQNHLQLTEQQVAECWGIGEQYFRWNDSASPDQKQYADMAATIEKELSRVLAPLQSQRLRQITLQWPDSFSSGAVATGLNLTASQRNRTRKIVAEFRKPRNMMGEFGKPAKPGGGGTEERDKRQIATDQFLAGLSPAQVEIWRQMTGEPLMEWGGMPRGGGFGGRGGPGERDGGGRPTGRGGRGGGTDGPPGSGGPEPWHK